MEETNRNRVRNRRRDMERKRNKERGKENIRNYQRSNSRKFQELKDKEHTARPKSQNIQNQDTTYKRP